MKMENEEKYYLLNSSVIVSESVIKDFFETKHRWYKPRKLHTLEKLFEKPDLRKQILKKQGRI